MPVFLDEGVERLHQMPGRAVYLRGETGVDVRIGAAPPLLSTRHQLQLDDSLRAEVDLHRAVQILTAERDDDADTLAQRRGNVRSLNDLRKIRRADFLLALANEHQIDRQLLASGLECMQRGEERRLRSLLIGGSAPDHDFADARPVDDSTLERR